MNNPELARGGGPNWHDKMMDLARQPIPLCDVTAESFLGGHTFERFQLSDLVLQLLLDTSEFRERAMSYRNFSVAAGAWCLDYPRYGRTLGYNIKFDETDKVNIHAEDLVVEKAQDAGFRQVSVLCVIGPAQEDHASGKQTETLHPCGRCRGRLGLSSLVSDKTLIVTARPDFKVIQLAELSAIVAEHEEGDASGITTFPFETTPEILRPREWVDTGSAEPIRVEEIDSSDYDSTIGQFLIQRYVEANQ